MGYFNKKGRLTHEKTLFITGFPGFLATDLLKQIIDDYREDIRHVYVLAMVAEQAQALEKIGRITNEKHVSRDLFSLIVGDITKDNLALNQSFADVTHVFHLAAIYDLAVPEMIAEKVNVQGTRQVNHWVKALPKLERYIYFSTAYVSGNREGRIYENELQVGQSFRNHYERTKFDAEVLVEDLKSDIPTTISRPGVVKGHSETGETIKFDGLYFLLHFYDRLKALPIIPYLKAGAAPEGNFVPSDYLIKAASFLGMNRVGQGKTYHLTDPHPKNMMELQKLLMESLLNRPPKGTLPISFVKPVLRNKQVQRWLGVEVEAMDYFIYQSSYDASQAIKDLKDAGIYCPPIEDTLSAMVHYYRKYKDDYTKRISI